MPDEDSAIDDRCPQEMTGVHLHVAVQKDGSVYVYDSHSEANTLRLMDYLRDHGLLTKAHVSSWCG